MNNYIILLTGPTASGKTDVSLELAKQINGEIINCDASSFKKDLNIGTAKVINTDVVHHLIDIIEPTETLSIANFQKISRNLIENIWERKKVPILVGGSGLYICACIYDYNLEVPKRNEEEYLDLDNDSLHDLLKQLDYQTSLKIHPNNRKRVIRAIELSKNGLNISDNVCLPKPIYNGLYLCFDVDRDILYKRINTRVDKMIENGLIDECKSLLLKYDCSKIVDIGYKEVFMYLNDQLDYQTMIDLIKQKTRNYAKRQLTWFRNKMELQFINDYTTENIISKIGELNCEKN